jgi:glycerol-3-phosphate acyltransferase PlsY
MNFTSHGLYYALAYLLGSIPFGLLIGRWIKGVDIRQHGSKNIGATNVFRVVGRSWGVTVLLLDALKGYAAVALPFAVMGRPEGFRPECIAIGLSAVLGHTFSVWIKFKGGKGVATSLGVFLALAPEATLATFGLWIAIFSLSRIISIASLSAAVIFPIAVSVLYSGRPGFFWIFGTALFLGSFIFYTHRGNIARLRKGEEKKII